MRLKVLVLCLMYGLALQSLQTPAYADYLSIAVTVACDKESNMALVRFGYGDDADTPKFAQLADSHYLTLSKAPADLRGGPEQNEASCKMPDGREIKVRKGYAPVVKDGESSNLPFHRYSVWVGGIRIIHAEYLSDDYYHFPSNAPFPFGVTIGAEGFRKCRFQLPEDADAYALTNDEQIKAPIPIACDSSPSPIAGPTDTAEYPAADAPAYPRVGSIQVHRYGEDNGLCAALVTKQKDRDTLSVEPPGVNAGIDWLEQPELDQFYEAKIDLLNSGKPRKVLRYSLPDHANNLSILLLPPDDAIDTEIEAIKSFDAIRGHIPTGWLIFDGAHTPYRASQNVDLNVLSYRGKHYVIAKARSEFGEGNDYNEWASPLAVLFAPQPNGRLEKICAFQRIYPNF